MASSALERQQSLLLISQTNSIWERLLNLFQTHVRPIVRGNARAAVEFGAKISVSVQKGFPFLHRINWTPFNEGEDLIAQAEKIQAGYGILPRAYLCLPDLHHSQEQALLHEERYSPFR